MSELVLRAAGREEDEALRAVIAAAFPDNPKRHAEITRWQYWDNPFGQTRVQVWDDGGEVVAQYAAYPVPVVLAGRRTLAGIGVDAAVAPTHQGRRLFTPMSVALYADAAAHGMPVTFCHPSIPISIAGITKAGWVPVARLRTRVLAIDDAWLARRFHLPRPVAGALRSAAFRLPRAGGLVASEVDAPPEGLDELWEQVSATVSYGVVRDAAWWQWRYASRPGSPYRFWEVRRAGRLVGAAAVLARESFGGLFLHVLELLSVADDAARALVRAVRDGADGAVGAGLVAVPGSQLDVLAGRAGLRALPRRAEPKPLMFGVVDPEGALAAPAPTLPWSVGWGDVDHL